MKAVANRHQSRIARDTLENMTPMMANIMGGMTFREAYRFVFNRDLDDRIDSLIAEYGLIAKSNGFVWELANYGWNPVNLKEALKH